VNTPSSFHGADMV